MADDSFDLLNCWGLNGQCSDYKIVVKVICNRNSVPSTIQQPKLQQLSKSGNLISIFVPSAKSLTMVSILFP